MAVTSGFFNGVNHDRRYDAQQVAQLFDGLIRDGIFGSIGTCFVVKPNNGRLVNVGIGRAWFNHTWIYNDAILPIEMPLSEVLMDRIDTIVIDVNWEESVREGSIKIVKGVPSMNPVKPNLIHTLYHNQYPLAYIRARANTSNINAADIENAVGTAQCPLVSGILQVISLDALIPQWRAILDNFVADNTNNFNQWFATIKAAYEVNWGEFTQWEEAAKAHFINWGNSLKDKLGEIPAVNLQLQINAMAEQAYRYYENMYNYSGTLLNASISEDSEISNLETKITRSSKDQIIFTTTITPKNGDLVYTKTIITNNASRSKGYNINETYSFDFRKVEALRLGTYTGTRDMIAETRGATYDVENVNKDLLDNHTFIVKP